MCGIIGHISKDKILERDVYVDMLNKIKHRGPDAQGLFYSVTNNLVLGHVRLSILDTVIASNQPMSRNNVELVFNGEIYNFVELRKEYLTEVNFVTNSDTEVLLQLYIKFGIEKTLKLIRGMFAIAIYDGNNNKVYLARDQVGKKPLYYYNDGQDFYFSSEIKAFKSIENIKFVLDNDVFNDNMYFRFSKKHSPFLNINMLKNGNFMEYDLKNHEVKTKEYFNFSDLVDEKLYIQHKNMGLTELVDKLDELLTKSIGKRLISDVPIASINSGGVDSSLISAIAFNLDKLKMFHIDVEGMSEKYYADALAKKIGQKVIAKKITLNDIEKGINSVLYHYEYPLVHPNSFGISEVSKLARKYGVKVLLGGEGADELFGGYRFQRKYYFSLKFQNKYTKKLIKYLRKVIKLFDDDVLAKSSERALYCDARRSIKKRARDVEKKYSFIKDKSEVKVNIFMLNILEEYLQPILLRADKMGMKNSVELRSPFMDLDIIEFALNLPPKYKFNILEGKYILKKVAERYLTNEIVYRKKVGFPIPFSKKFETHEDESPDRNFIIYSKKILNTLFK